ncbi:hypothetical protein E6O75_ATG00538 [Venturia nashicola]|uniref:Uncharacterized protein n=1 Tax=Venturia nashicola TaxID=86259 RepID=A0A4Z1PE36_9PEZI|nr:hypothetical protein E6O75_ATG00538 [Venturia nashicola]
MTGKPGMIGSAASNACRTGDLAISAPPTCSAPYDYSKTRIIRDAQSDIDVNRFLAVSTLDSILRSQIGGVKDHKFNDPHAATTTTNMAPAKSEFNKGDEVGFIYQVSKGGKGVVGIRSKRTGKVVKLQFVAVWEYKLEDKFVNKEK